MYIQATVQAGVGPMQHVVIEEGLGQRFTRVFVEEAEVVISNTGDAGYQPRPADLGPTPVQEMSFPAKGRSSFSRGVRKSRAEAR